MADQKTYYFVDEETGELFETTDEDTAKRVYFRRGEFADKYFMRVSAVEYLRYLRVQARQLRIDNAKMLEMYNRIDALQADQKLTAKKIDSLLSDLLSKPE